MRKGRLPRNSRATIVSSVLPSPHDLVAHEMLGALRHFDKFVGDGEIRRLRSRKAM